MEKDRGIWRTTWRAKHQRTKKICDKHIAENVMVVGKDRKKLAKNPIFVGRVYQSIFGKDKWQSRRDEDCLVITKIDFISYHGESNAPDDDKVFE